MPSLGCSEQVFDLPASGPVDLEEAEAAPLTATHLDGERLPLFWVRTWDQELTLYRRLLLELGQHQPVVTVAPPGGERGQAYPGTVTEWASYCREQLREVDYSGPLFVGGWSFGGVVALELAEQLRAEGRTILLVPMIDSRLPKRWIEARTLRVVQRLGRHMQLYAELQRGERAAYWRERWEWRVHHLRDAAERARVRLFGVDEPEGTVPDDPIPDANGAEPAQAEPEQPGRLNMSALQKAIWVCYLKYRPRRHSLPAALYICEDSRDHVDDGCLGWSAYLQGPLESTPVPGKHITVFRRPHVQVLARRLRDSLAYAHSRQTGG